MMNRLLLVGIVVIVTALLLGAIAMSSALHSPNDADCSGLVEDSSAPYSGIQDGDMYVGDEETSANCPVDDAAEMGGSAST